MTDRELAERYRQCDLTLHPGLGEGFCYPAFESLACGVPVVHGNYASCASLLAICGLGRFLVEPIGYRFETEHNCLRPVYDAHAWARKVIDVLAIKPLGMREHVEHLDWKAIGPRFRKWFNDGVTQ